MKLFTKEIDKKLAAQYHLGADLNAQVVVAKIFNPYGNARWYLINSDPSDPDYLWAIVQIGNNVEVGSVSRKELENLRVGVWGFRLERDLGFRQRNAQEVYNGVIGGKTYAKGGMADVTPTYAVGGEISPETLTKFAEDLQQAESEAYDNLDIRSGGQLYRTPSLQKQYASAMNQAFAELTKKHAHLKDINVENGQTIYDYLEDQNYHSLNNYLALRGIFGTKYKQKYEGYHTKYPDNYLDPANMVGAQSYAVGGLTPGRWYKDNQGVEYKFIGKIDNGPNKDQLLFTDGTQKMYKPLDDFGEKPKENKLFGFFEEGGEIDLFEHYEDIPPHVKKVLDKYNEGLEEGDYKTLEKAKNELESIGYTFDYDLGGGAYNLHKMEEGDSMSGYMGDGGKKAIIDEVSSMSFRGQYDDYEMVVISKELDKDGGRLLKDRFLVSAKDIGEAKSLASDLWREQYGRSDLRIVKVMSDEAYRHNYMGKMADGGKLNIGTIKKTDTDVLFDKKSGAFYVNVIDGGGNRVNKIDVNTIDDVFAKYPTFRLNTKGEKEFPESMADGGGVGRIVMIPTFVVKEINDSVKMGYDTLVEGMIGRKRKGVLLINKDFEVRGTYDLNLKDSIQNIIDKVKSGTFKVDAIDLKEKGGTTKFADKVKSIQASLLKRKKVAPSVQKDYGKTYNKAEAKEAATRITGAMTAKERIMNKNKMAKGGTIQDEYDKLKSIEYKAKNSFYRARDTEKWYDSVGISYEVKWDKQVAKLKKLDGFEPNYNFGDALA
jgi:hypothetical protein